MSRYEVFVSPSAWREVKDLPGHMKQRIKRVIDALADDPHPPDSRSLSLVDLESTLSSTIEARRLRIAAWRIVYTVNEADRVIDILAVRKRPPYDYGDLAQLLNEGPNL